MNNLINSIATESIQDATREAAFYGDNVTPSLLDNCLEMELMMKQLKFETEIAKGLFITLVKSEIKKINSAFYVSVYPVVKYN